MFVIFANVNFIPGKYDEVGKPDGTTQPKSQPHSHSLSHTNPSVQDHY